jgi:hypothetical protein
LATEQVMSDRPDTHAFPAVKLGDFLRAMTDPEGTGHIDADREREIALIEQRVADITRDPLEPSDAETSEPA